MSVRKSDRRNSICRAIDAANSRPPMPRRNGALPRHALLTGVSALALVLATGEGVSARQLGGGGQSFSAATNAAAVAIQSAQQAAAVAKQSQNSLTRATQAIQAMQAVQNAARSAAVVGPNNLGADPNHPGLQLPNVPDGLNTGGLVPDSGLASSGVANPVTTWTGANTPTQTSDAKTGLTMATIEQTAPKAILNWTTFNVGKNTIVNFRQGDSTWIALNRVTDPSGAPSQILGQVNAPGSIYLINQNGIIFGGSSQVNVGTLIASSLWMNQQLFNNGQLNNPNGEFLFVGSAIPFANPNSSVTDQNTDVAPSNGFNGDVTVQAGANIVATPTAAITGGRVSLIGPNVTNSGTIITTAGQTILAAGLQVAFVAHDSSDPSLRGLDVFVGDVGTGGIATNSGVISMPRGDVTMVGKSIIQNGAIDSSTSVAFNGRVDLLATYNTQVVTSLNGQGQESSTYAPTIAGSVELGAGSVISVLPELDSADTIAASSLTLRSQINLEGNVLHLASGAEILAPSGNVSLQAGQFVLTNATLGGYQLLNTSGQITLDSGALIDVSGSQDVAASVADNFIQVQLRGPQFADSPLQRGGALRGQTVTIDIRQTGTNPDGTTWVGTPLGDVSGYVGLIQHNVGQLTVDGGSVSLAAGDSVVLQQGSMINVSGGWLNYQGSLVSDTTRLVGSDGRLYNISQATPDRIYAGVYTGFTVSHSHWGIQEIYSNPLLSGVHDEPGYIQGGNGGTLNIQAPMMALDGSQLLGQTIAGERQQLAPPKPGVLSLAFFGIDPATLTTRSEPAQPMGIGPPSIVFGSGSSSQSADANTIVLAPSLLGSGGFGSLAIDDGDGDITVGAGVSLVGAAGGSLTLSGKNVTVDGSIVMPSGHISITTHDFSPYGAGGSVLTDTSVDPSRGNFMLGSNASLDASGLITNTTPVALNGGSIQIQSVTIDLQAGSTIDVSGGVAVITPGKFGLGNGGAISLLAGLDGPIHGGSLVDHGADLRGYGGKIGGSLTLQSTLVQVGGSATDPNTLTNTLVLSPGFFNRGGFSSFTVNGIGEVLGPDFAVALRIAAGTRIAPVTTNMTVGLDAQGGILVEPVVNQIGQRTPVNLSFNALGEFGALDPAPIRGDFVMESGAVIQTDPGSNVSINGASVTSHTADIAGSIFAPGGSISVSGSNTSEKTTGRGVSVILEPGSVLSTKGQAVTGLDARGLQTTTSVLAGGAVNLSGNILVLAGSVIDVSGISGTLDGIPDVSGNPSFRQGLGAGRSALVESDGGTINFQAGERLFIDGGAELLAGGGGSAAAGGTLSISATYSPSTDPAFNFVTPIIVSQATLPSLPSGFNAGAVFGAYLGIDRFDAGGFDALSLKGQVEFSGPVSISARGSIVIGGTALSLSADNSVTLAAPYVALGRSFQVPGALPNALALVAPSYGAGVLTVVATGLIDIGDLALQTIGSASFSAPDIRGDGTLDVTGTITMQAGQIYPATSTQFVIAARDYTDASGVHRQGQINIFGSGSRPLPLSAGGELDVYASVINQGGVLRAPFGVINLGFDPTAEAPADPLSGLPFEVTQSVTLTSGSVTSVSGIDPATGQAIVVPYGIDLNGASWIDPRSADITAGGLPAKSVNIFGNAIDARASSTVDLRGGGDLYAYSFVPGLGGSKDILNPATTASFAVLPGYAFGYAPYGAFNLSPPSGNTNLGGDPGYVSGSLTVGDKIYLNGGGGLAAGVYTLLPARYALLPGAFLVTPQKGAASATVAKPDGSNMMAGYRFNDPGGTGVSARPFSEFEVASGAVVRQRAEYDDFFANSALTQGALDHDSAVPRLPQDAGHLLLDAGNVIAFNGAVLSQTPGGLGGQVDIASPNDIVITGLGANSGGYPASDVFLNAQDLTALGLDSLLIGGIRSNGPNGVTVQVTTNNVTLDNAGTPLAAADVTLVANNSLTLAAGSDLEQRGTLSHPADVLVFGSAATPRSGNGVLVRVSSDHNAGILRAGFDTTTNPMLTIKDGATLSGASVIVDSTASASLSSAAILRTQALSIGSGRISLQLDPAASLQANAGLVLSSATLNALQASLQSLSLLSYSSIDIYGSGSLGNVDASGQPTAASLAFHTGEIRGFGSGASAPSVTFTAQSILLDNVNGSISPGSVGNSGGTLTFQATTLSVGTGQLAIDQYGTVVLSASNGVLVEGTGGLSVQHDLTVTTPLLTGATAANQTMSAGGALLFNAPGTTSTLAGGLGASFTATGAQVTVNADIVLPSGALTLHATGGDVVVGNSNNGLNLDVSGVAQAFNDVTKYTSAGSLSLVSDTGSVNLDGGGLYLDAQRVQDGAVPAAGDAGTLSVSAANGQFTFGPALRLSAIGGSGGKNGSFTLDVGSLATTAPLNTLLNAATFTEARSIRVRTGDVTLDGVARAHSFTLSADQGAITVTGTVDASGPTGGSIFLAASKDVTLTPGSLLDVHALAFDDAGKGGSVDIETLGNGTKGIDIQAGSTIDLSVAGGVGGTLHLRAPRTGVSATDPGGTDVLIAPIDGTIKNASSIVVEGYKVYDTGPSGSIDGVEPTILSEADSFLGSAGNDTHYSAIVNRLLANNMGLKSVSLIEPGAEVRNGNTSLTPVTVTLTNAGSSAINVNPNTPVTFSAGASVTLSYSGSTAGQTITFSGTGTASVTWSNGPIGTVLGTITAPDGTTTQIFSGTPATIPPGSTVKLFAQLSPDQVGRSPAFTVMSGSVTITSSAGGTLTANGNNVSATLSAQSSFVPLGSVAINPAGTGTVVWLGTDPANPTSNAITLPANVSVVLPNGTPNGVKYDGSSDNDVISATVSGSYTTPDGQKTTFAAGESFSVPPGTSISLDARGQLAYVSGSGGAISLLLPAGRSYGLDTPTSAFANLPGPQTKVFTPNGNLTLGTLTSSTLSDWDLSAWRFGPNSAPGVLTLRAPGDIALYNSIGDGFSNPGNLTPDILAQWGQALFTLAPGPSWSFRFTAGADLTAADDHQVQSLAALGDSGSLLLGKYSNAPSPYQESGTGVNGQTITTRAPYFGASLQTCDLIVCYNYYQAIRTGTGDIDIVAGHDVQLRNPFAVIYTAGQPAAALSAGTFDTPVLDYSYYQGNPSTGSKNVDGTFATLTPIPYPAQYSQDGGNVSVTAGNDVTHVTLAGGVAYEVWQQDSSKQMPTDWLYRRGYVDPTTGQFGTIFNIDAYYDDLALGLVSRTTVPNPAAAYATIASTSWWVDFSNFSEGIGALGGGNVKLIAGRDISNVDAVVPTNARMPGKDSNGAPIAPNAASMIELGGGDLLVQAGRDINGGVYYVERGQGVLRAGSSIHSNSTRSTANSLSGNTDDPSTWLGTTLFLGQGSFSVSAGGDLLLGSVVNPFALPQGWGNTYWYKTYFSTYAADDSVDLSSLTGNVSIRDQNVASPGSGDLLGWFEAKLGENNTSQPWLATLENNLVPFQTTMDLMPGSLRVTAFSGGINLEGNITLAPSPNGTIDLLAAGAISGSQTSIDLSDVDPDRIPGVATPFGLSAWPAAIKIAIRYTGSNNPGIVLAPTRGNTSVSSAATLSVVQSLLLPLDPLFQESGSTSLTLGQKQLLHATTPEHLNDSIPVHLYAGGDISGIDLFSAKAAEIVAGHDITDIAFYIQDLQAADLTRVVAGRDIIAFDPNSPLRLQAASNPNYIFVAPNAGDIQLAGPGSLEVLAGRNLDLGVDTGTNNINDGTHLGITTIGNFANPFLPNKGADVFVGAGLGNLSGLDVSRMSFGAFTAQFLNPATAGDLANRYLPDLGVFMNMSGASNTDIWNAYQGLLSDKRDRLALDIFYLVLRDAGRDNSDPSSSNFKQFTNGYNAIADLFPGNTWKGDISLTSREIKTKSGGDINIFAPGGALNVGIDLASNQPIDQGILTEGGGNIDIFTRNSVNVGTSRIFTLDGGNEIIWSTTGDIAAGSASKTVHDAVPLRVLIDPDTTNVETDLAGFATGGGIGVLQARPDAPVGNIDLIAPVGTVDAGDAGLRSSGDIHIVATIVLNADNISAAGKVTGVPVVQAPNIGALTSAANVAGAASKNADTPTGSTGNNNQPSIIIVEVLGYGGGDGDGSTPDAQQNDDHRRRDGREGFNERGHGQEYNDRSAVQIAGYGVLSESESQLLTPDERQMLSKR